MDKQQPTVSVGIMSSASVHFVLNGNYRFMANMTVTGSQQVDAEENSLLWNGQHYQEILLSPINSEDSFTLCDVIIGVSFHWRRKEDQTFRGSLKLIVENGLVTAINVVPVEDYLTSVISSEMSANASLELLKAHAVISRSWLLAQIQHPSGCCHLRPSG